MRRGSAALLMSVVLSACGTLPLQADRPLSSAQQPSADSRLVRIARDSSPAPTLTGFRLMPLGFYSPDARVQLARRASHSLDVQYYQIADDRTGRLLLRNLRDAALRGVRVRLLVDDLYTTGGDPMFHDLAAFPNVEVRLFNPFCDVGIGIARQALNDVFRPFYSTKPDGMGIGLCISRAIVERQGGRLWVTANDGPGVTFWLSIPCTPTTYGGRCLGGSKEPAAERPRGASQAAHDAAP